MEDYVYSKKSIIVFFIVVTILSAIAETIYCLGNIGYFIFVF